MAEATQDIVRYYQMCAERPDLASSQRDLGGALGRLRHGTAALGYLRQAVARLSDHDDKSVYEEILPTSPRIGGLIRCPCHANDENLLTAVTVIGQLLKIGRRATLGGRGSVQLFGFTGSTARNGPRRRFGI